MNLPPLFPNPLSTSDSHDRSPHIPHIPYIPSLQITEGWGEELLSVDFPPEWSIEWSNSPRWNAWQGFETDKAWLIENFYRMPGRVQPVAFYRETLFDSHLVRVGGLLLELQNFCGSDLRIYSGNTSVVEIMRNSGMGVSLPPNCVLHHLEEPIYDASHGAALYMNSLDEHRLQRNRWAEQMDRGGCPPETLLLMFSHPEHALHAETERIRMEYWEREKHLKDPRILSDVDGQLSRNGSDSEPERGTGDEEPVYNV